MIVVPQPLPATHTMPVDELAVSVIVYVLKPLPGVRVAISISTPPAGEVTGAPLTGVPVTGVGFGATFAPVTLNATRLTAVLAEPTRRVSEGGEPSGVKMNTAPASGLAPSKARASAADAAWNN